MNPFLLQHRWQPAPQTLLSKRAFSLIEVIIAGSLLVLIGTMIYRMNVGSVQKTLTGKMVVQMAVLKGANDVLYEVRRCSDFVRPHLGETCSYLVARDMTNQMLFLYLDKDVTNSANFKRELFRLVSYRDTYSGTYKKENEKVLLTSISRLTFTCLDPDTVQVNLTVSNDREDFQFVTRVGAMNLGDLE